VDELLGRSWKGADIENLLGQDEEQVYRALGLIDPLRDLRQPLRAALTHGTHVLDLAAGYDWQNKAEAEKAAKRPIIAVQLPTQVAENRSDTWLPQCLKRALDWILIKADELSAELSKKSELMTPDGRPRRLPLIVNGSFASMAGPQDGYSDVERRITQFIKTYRDGGPEDLCTFVLAAGNSLQLRGAAQMDIPSDGVGEIRLRLQPDDKTPNFVQIWLPKVKDVCEPKKQQVEVSLSYRHTKMKIAQNHRGSMRRSNGRSGTTLVLVYTTNVSEDPVARVSALRSQPDRRPTIRMASRWYWCRRGYGRSGSKTSPASFGISISGCIAMIRACSRAAAHDSPISMIRNTRCSTRAAAASSTTNDATTTIDEMPN
jgi:hypothetical protein